MSATEVGVAYVRLLPSMQGFSDEVKRKLGDGLADPAKKAGDDAGRRMGDGIGDGLDSNQGKLKGAASRAGDILKLGLAAVGVVAAGLLVAGFTSALNLEVATDKLEAQLGNSPFAQDAGEIAGQLYTEAFGDSVADTGAAVRKVIENGLVFEDATREDVEAATRHLLTFTDVMEQDMDMATQAVSSMLRSGLVDNAEEAFDIMTAAAQKGADKAGDLTATFQEYGTSFRETGLSAADAAGLMVQGLQAGARDADKVADALKEVGIRAQDASTTSAQGFAAIGLSAEEMTAAFAAGGPQARAALDQVLDGLRAMEDPTARNAAAVQLFGGQAEDLGDALFALDLDTVAESLGETEGATAGLASAYDNASTKIESFKRGAMMALTEFIGGTVIPVIERLAAVLGPPIQDALAMVEDAAAKVGEFWYTLTSGFFEDEGTPIERFALQVREALSGLTPVFDAVQQGWTTVKTAFQENPELLQGILIAVGIAVAALAIALGALVVSALAAAAPFIAVAAVVAAVAAGILWLYNNVESFRSFVDQTIPLVADVFTSAFDLIMAGIDALVAIGLALWGAFGDEIIRVAQIAWGLVQGIITGALNIIAGIIKLVTAVIRGDWSAAWDAIKQILSGAVTIIMSIITAAVQLIPVLFSAAWSAVRLIFSTAWALLTSIVSSGVSSIVEWFRGLPAKLRSALSTVASAITSPFSSAFNALKKLWNNTVGGFGFSVPDWVPGVGGKSFKIPTMHTGGIFAPAGTGDEGLALLKRGEGVFTPEQMDALGAGAAATPGAAPAEVVVRFDATDRRFKEWMRNSVRVEGGGNVQRWAGQN